MAALFHRNGEEAENSASFFLREITINNKFQNEKNSNN